MVTMMPNIAESLPGAVAEALLVAGANLKAIRETKGMTVKQLASRMLVSTAAIRRLEKGDPKISVGIMISALWAMDLRISDVFPGGSAFLSPVIGRPPFVPLPAQLADDDF
jgi:transcriptional regulator with XRE-family HTH domain